MANDLLLALCVHGAKHRWQRLAWIRDVAALLQKGGQLDLARLLVDARRLGCARLMLLGLGVAAECAGANLPPGVAAAIRADGMASLLVKEVFDGLWQDCAEPRNDRIDSFRFRMREQWRDRVSYVTRTLTAPRRPHLEAVALPAGFGWGYHPIRVGLDFAVLPVRSVLRRLTCRKDHLGPD